MTFKIVFLISKFQNVKAFKFNIQNRPRLMVKDTNLYDIKTFGR